MSRCRNRRWCNRLRLSVLEPSVSRLRVKQSVYKPLSVQHHGAMRDYRRRYLPIAGNRELWHLGHINDVQRNF